MVHGADVPAAMDIPVEIRFTAANVRLLAPGAAHGLGDTPLIPECTRRGGAVQFIARVAHLRWRTLVY